MDRGADLASGSAPAAAYEIIQPDGPAAAAVIHLPHAATAIPDDVRAELLVADADLARELLRLTDWFTDDLFAPLGAHGATRFVARLSRLVFDPERFLVDDEEPMAARGQGVVYTFGTDGQRLREPSATLRRERIEALYRPYHAALDDLVRWMLERFGGCLVIDGHSFASLPLPSELDQSPGRADICLGTDAWHTPAALHEALDSAFRAEGWRVDRDRPFAGTFVPTGHYRRDTRVHSIMIEVRRGLYMDERTGERGPDYEAVRDAIERAIVGSGVLIQTRDQGSTSGQ